MLPASFTGLRVLDLGCGFGAFARKAREKGAASVVGIDVSANMLAEAAKQTNDSGIGYRHTSIEQFDGADAPFDLVVSSLALHYVEDYEATVAHVANFLVKGGRFVFSVEHPICTAMASQQWVRDAEGHALYWPIDDYRLEGPRQTTWFVEGVVKYHRYHRDVCERPDPEWLYPARTGGTGTRAGPFVHADSGIGPAPPPSAIFNPCCGPLTSASERKSVLSMVSSSYINIV
jgi:SAM-dependent methyltransferase